MLNKCCSVVYHLASSYLQMFHKICFVILILHRFWDFQNKIRWLCTTEGNYREMDVFGSIFTAVFSMYVQWSCPHCEGLTSRCPEVFDKTPVSFFFFFLPLPGQIFQLETDAIARESQTYGSFTFCRQETLRGPKVIHQTGAKARVTTHISWPLRQF